jgi:DNA mismatch repair protein MutS
MTTPLSPMMLQWQECKKKANDAILFFRLGDFYEAFNEDAELISKALDVVLTKRQETPMAGVPAHACEGYIDKLVAKGYRVAIAEQMEDPKTTKGIVKRDVVRIITPGTLISSHLLNDKSPNYLASLVQVNSMYGLAIIDLTTADFRVMEFMEELELWNELARLNPKEVLISTKLQKKAQGEYLFQIKEEWYFDHRIASDRLYKHFEIHSLDGFGLKGMTAAISAAGALFGYIKEDLNLSLSHVKSLRMQQNSKYMSLDRTTLRHLELVEPLHDKGATLLNHLDHTTTPMGGRLLKEWLLHPLLDISEIEERQTRIESLLKDPERAMQLQLHLKEVRDLERLIMRIETGYATPRDIVALRISLTPLASISALIDQKLPDLTEITVTIEKAVVETPPLRISDGGIFKEGFNTALDEIRSLKSDSHQWILNYQNELREQTQIKTLKVSFTQAFGYYIEVSRGQSDRMPESFQRRQTLVNAERFISPALKEYEHKILTAEGRISSIENELFQTLRREIIQWAEPIRFAARRIAEIDCFVALAFVAKTYSYTKPHLHTTNHLSIEEGRHPVIEASLKGETFIPNDVCLSEIDQRLLIITGPNMAGKSTYIRQVALIVILAQIGSFVPAKAVNMGIVDKVFSRIGASDDLSRGQSTFMVEMSETANILNNATSNSLVILDEIGRGTSTYDGISIAWAVAEHLLTIPNKRAKTLFATHYWELTKMEEEIAGAANYNVAVHESDKGIIFLRKIIRGGTDKSYGIHVAKLAGLPPSVIKRATELLQKLHANAAIPVEVKPEKQLELF